MDFPARLPQPPPDATDPHGYVLRFRFGWWWTWLVTGAVVGYGIYYMVDAADVITTVFVTVALCVLIVHQGSLTHRVRSVPPLIVVDRNGIHVNVLGARHLCAWQDIRAITFETSDGEHAPAEGDFLTILWEPPGAPGQQGARVNLSECRTDHPRLRAAINHYAPHLQPQP
jgi:hypothetical protein